MTTMQCLCETERFQFLPGASLCSIRQFPFQICTLCSSDWLPISPPIDGLSFHIPQDAGAHCQLKSPEDEDFEQSESYTVTNCKGNEQEREVEVVSPKSPKSPLNFSIENILYGSTTKIISTHSQRKPPRPRPVFSPSQRQYLEKCFHSKKYLQKNERTKIASLLNLTEKQVKIWFQNRRVKRKQEMHQNMSDRVAPTTHGYLCQQCFPH